MAPEWRNWAGDQACRPAAIEHPATREDVAASVRRARDRGVAVKVAGAGHSFTEAALTDGVMLVLDRLTRFIDADRSSGLVKVEAGISLRELNRRLDALGAITAVTLRTLPAFTIRRVDEPRPLAELLASLEALGERNEHFEFFVFPYAETALAIERNRTPEAPRRRGRLAAWVNDILLANHTLAVMARTGRRVPAQNRRLAAPATRLLSRTERVVRSHEAFASERRGGVGG